MNISHRYIVDQQFLYLSRLQELQPNRPVLVQRPQNGDFRLEDKRWYDWHKVFSTEPLLTCSVLTNEVAFDPDQKDWTVLKKELDKLTDYLDTTQIPYLLSWSGGNGVHLEVFFKKDIEIPHRLAENIEKRHIDVGLIVRSFIANWLLDQAGVQPEVIQIDFSKIKWSSKRKGSMIRFFGSIRPNGGIKTLIKIMPEQRPRPGMLPVVFPEYLETWSISFLQREILQAIQTEIDSGTYEEDPAISWIIKAVNKAKAEGRVEYDPSKKSKSCIGLQAALKGGISEGYRDAVATGIAYALRFWKGEEQENAMKIINRWCDTCTPALEFRGRGIDQKIIRIFQKQKMEHAPCTFFIKAGLCQGSKCRILASSA